MWKSSQIALSTAKTSKTSLANPYFWLIKNCIMQDKSWYEDWCYVSISAVTFNQRIAVDQQNIYAEAPVSSNVSSAEISIYSVAFLVKLTIVKKLFQICSFFHVFMISFRYISTFLGLSNFLAPF